MSEHFTACDPMATPEKRPPLTVAQVLAWADAYHAAHGHWPSSHSGPVAGIALTTWKGIDHMLRKGFRGLPGGSSLSRLLDEHRPGHCKVLSMEAILAWADAHHAATGQWPTHRTGRIRHAPSRETWHRINHALAKGARGLPGGQNLAWLLHEHRQVKPRISREAALARAQARRRWNAERQNGRGPLTAEQILFWADQYHAATGRWPRASTTAPIPGVMGESWRTIDSALIHGQCGLPGGSSLSRLLLEQRGPQTLQRSPELTVEQVLAWADAYHAAHGRWPDLRSGRVAESPKHSWAGIDTSLKVGAKGLPGGSSLFRLLRQQRGPQPRKGPPDLTVEQILRWADAYHEEHGRWPDGASGRVAAAPAESWPNISQMLRTGGRGLPGGSSLGRLLAEQRGVRNWTSLPALSIDQILAWADAHHAATGRWPTVDSGAVKDAPDEIWRRIDAALKQGTRGLPGGSALGRLLDEHRPWGRRSLAIRTMLAWKATPLIVDDASSPSPAQAGTSESADGGIGSLHAPDDLV
jgi:hypothetical protein